MIGRKRTSVRTLLLVVTTMLCAGAKAQQSGASTFNDTFESTFAKARDACKALWSDHAFDPLRDKIPLGDDKPTFAMLKNAERLKPKDRPLADLAIKTVEKCREGYTATYAMLPPQVAAMIHGVERRQDAIIAELYRAKITFGEFNIAMNRLVGELSAAFSGIPTQSQPEFDARRSSKEESATSTAPSTTQKPEQKEKRSAVVFSANRLALVIGNSNYANLPKLPNPANDARAMADILTQMGYKTRLLIDASEQNIRRDVRQFAGDSTKADVAVVFYAGHGAQVNGNNYLLPVDIDIPRTEVDIQFSGLKVDDLVNSIGSNTKIVFLDACRDNPVLFKNLVKGRGSSPTGLAPASSSNLDQRPGGGVFIAYATDAGSVAEDGNGKHSPFTEALLRNIQKPISIDDMFSLVTKEVRLVTKNAQRPYKYASLESILCVAPNCSSSTASTNVDVFQQAAQSEADELRIALQTNNSDALETYLKKYPDTTKRSEILEEMNNIKRSEFTEWTLYEIGNERNPQYMQIGSIQKFGGRGKVRQKVIVDPNGSKTFYGRTFPDAAYQEQIVAYDCVNPTMAIAEDSIFNASGELLFHYNWGDPKYLNISTLGMALKAGMVGYTAKNIVCNEGLATPLVSKKQIIGMAFTALSSTVTGDGEILYGPSKKINDSANEIEIVTVLKNFFDHNIKQFFPSGTTIPNPPDYRTEVDLVRIKCDASKVLIARTEFWSASNELVRTISYDPPPNAPSDIKPLSPFAALQDIFCQKDYGGLGIQLKKEGESLIVRGVFDGSPAAKAGVATNDIISHIDHEPISGLTTQQAVEKLRGSAGSGVVLTVVRKGQDAPIDLSVAREIIHTKSTEAQ